MKGLAIHAALAVFGLLFAYQTWTRPAVTEEPLAVSGEPLLLDCKPDQLEKLELQVSTHTVQLVPDRSKTPAAYWLTTTPVAAKPKEAEAKKADAGAELASSEPGKPDAKGLHTIEAQAPVTYRGSQRVAELLADLLPLRPLRDLGKLEASRDAEFGFDKATTTFRATCGGQAVALTLAGRTYGNNDSYARDLKTGKTYLLPGKPFVELQNAQFKLMQNDLHAFTLADVDAATIKVGAQAKQLAQRDRAVRGQAQWVDAAKPDQRNEAYGNWFDRVSKLRIRKYLPRNATPGDELSGEHGAVTPVLQIDYALEGKPKGKLEIVSVAGDKDQRHYYARTETSEVWVTLYDTLVKEIEADLALVVGEGAASQAPAAPAAAPTPAPQQ